MEGEEEFEIESIEQHRLREYKRKGKGCKVVRSFFVKWKGFPPEHDQWVTEADMTADFEIRNSILDEYCKKNQLPLTIIKANKVQRTAPVRSNKRKKKTNQ